LTRGCVELLACETCGSADRAVHGNTGGERLIAALRSALAERRDSPVTLASVRCLWACKRSCAVHLRSAGRAGYVLCDLAPSESSAHALLDYAAMYGESSDGAVPFRRWPDALRGHFLCRTPPLSTEPTTTALELASDPEGST
jgi:predicted metal-binding protein